VRTTPRTAHDAHVCFQCAGFIEVTPAFIALNNGEDVSTDFGDQYFFSSLQLETGDERYSWVTTRCSSGSADHFPDRALDTACTGWRTRDSRTSQHQGVAAGQRLRVTSYRH
jgi:Protein of unknown function (DUF3237)